MISFPFCPPTASLIDAAAPDLIVCLANIISCILKEGAKSVAIPDSEVIPSRDEGILNIFLDTLRSNSE